MFALPCTSALACPSKSAAECRDLCSVWCATVLFHLLSCQLQPPAKCCAEGKAFVGHSEVTSLQTACRKWLHTHFAQPKADTSFAMICMKSLPILVFLALTVFDSLL